MKYVEKISELQKTQKLLRFKIFMDAKYVHKNFLFDYLCIKFC